MSGIAADVIPFGMAIAPRQSLWPQHCRTETQTLSARADHELRQAYRMLFSSEGTLKERLEDVESMFSTNPLAKQIIDFIKIQSDRSFCVPNNAATPSR
jgi:UDP-N-acetylglucosamine acyltransferase